ncbi:MAG: acyl-CoA thioesterase [Saprospiraceae bacterium]|nr:acyl-CoA thioesterase [Saprospiraceae bacterium]
MKKVLKSFHQVRFQDCDPFRHLNNARYLDYFINAREDQVKEHYDLDLFEFMHKEGTGWVVGSNQIQYCLPAQMQELICIESTLFDFGPKHLSVEMTMWDETQTQLKAILWVSFVHLNLRTQQTTEHNDRLMDLFGSVVISISESDFLARCRAVRKEVGRLSSQLH